MSFVRHLLFTALGAGLGYATGRIIGKDEEEKRKLSLALGATGGLLGLGGSILTQKPKGDTVNYTLYNKGNGVYDGITYEDRIEIRMSEHEVSGKKFDSYDFDYAKPREQALRLEKKSIKRNRYKYNIQHNS